MDNTDVHMNQLLRGTHKYYKDNLINRNKTRVKKLFSLIVDKTLFYKKDNCSAFTKEEKKICDVFKKYSPIPSDDTQLGINRQLIYTSKTIGRGVNGVVYYNPSENFIIKRHLEEDDEDDEKDDEKDKKSMEDVIKETFVNFICINEIIIKTENSELVPTYGYFICDNVTVCTATGGRPSIFLIQEKIDGDSLDNFLKSNKPDKTETLKIFFKILDALVNIRANSDYDLIHGDLHTGNIMIVRNQNSYDIKIIDWGMASFTLDGKRYQNWLEQKLQDELVDAASCDIPKVVSCLYDVFFLLNCFIIYSRNSKQKDMESLFLEMKKNVYPNSLKPSDLNLVNTYLWEEIPTLLKRESSNYIIGLVDELNIYDYKLLRSILSEFLKPTLVVFKKKNYL